MNARHQGRDRLLHLRRTRRRHAADRLAAGWPSDGDASHDRARPGGRARPVDPRLRSWQRILRHIHHSQVSARSRARAAARRRGGAPGAQHHRLSEEPADEPIRGLSRRGPQPLLPRQARRHGDRADGISHLQSAARVRDALRRLPHRAHRGHALGAVRAAAEQTRWRKAWRAPSASATRCQLRSIFSAAPQ